MAFRDVPYVSPRPLRGLNPFIRPQVIPVKSLRNPRSIGYQGKNFGVLGMGPSAAGAAQGLSVGSAVGGASAMAIGAAAGSVVPGLGTAIGAVVGAVVGALTAPKANTAGHIGGWDGALVQAIGQLPTTVAGIGRQIPWNEDSHGLVQMIEALLATQVYMAWDASLVSNYAVCAHWAMTFSAAVQTVCQGIHNGTIGKSVTVSISESPGAGGISPLSFTFTNPGFSVGPEAIAGSVIMGSSGLMYAMIAHLGETAAHASENASNAAAQKVYALMIDYWAAQYQPAVATPVTPVANVKPAVIAASTAVNTAAVVAATPVSVAVAPVVSAAPAAPVVASVASVAATPAAAVATTVDPTVAALIAQLQASNASQAAMVQALESQGVNTSQPAVQAAVAAAAPSGLDTNTLLLVGGAIVAIFLLMKK